MTNAKIVLVLLVTGTCLVLYLYYNITNSSFRRGWSTGSITDLSEITSNLRAVLDYMNNQPKTDPIVLQLRHQLLQTITKLDPSFTQKSHPDFKKPIFTCPEIFINASRARPHFINGSWEVKKCNLSLPFDKTVSILLYSSEKDFCSVKLPRLARGIRELYPSITIHAAVVKDNKCSTKILRDVNVVMVTPTTSVGKIWNRLISKVTTPLVLIGRDLDYFNWFTKIERQISVFDVDPRINIVGGSIRNKTGHWQVGCLQSLLLSYVLEYKNGYYASKNECMICDNLLGPFLTRTEFVKQLKLDEYAPMEMLFEEFFLRVKNSSSMVMNCPDAMYMATDPAVTNRIFDRLTWTWLVKTLHINRVLLPDGVIHKYSCKESQVSCKELYKTAGYLTMPICCMDAAVHGLEKFHELCKKNNIRYELWGGSVLGAVKFQDVTPWDYDGDGGYYVSNSSFFMSKVRNLSDSSGEVLIDHLNEKVEGYFKISTLGFFTEMWSNKKLTWDYAPGFADFFYTNPTKMKIRGVWVNGPASPGLYARNCYGVEMLKHVNRKGKRPQYAAYDIEQKFPPCRKKFHACLDQFDVDGSLQFKFP